MSEPQSDLWKLCNVHVFVRHGARTPLHLLPGCVGNTVKWDKEILCDPRVHYAPIYLLDLHGKARGPLPGFAPDKDSYVIPGDGCWSGALTGLGQEECKLLGRQLRLRYGHDLWGLETPNPDDIFLRSSNLLRNLYSLRSLLSGFWTVSEMKDIDRLSVVVAEKFEETLHQNRRRIGVINANVKEGASRSSTEPEHLRTRQALLKVLQKYDPQLTDDFIDPNSAKYIPLFKLRDDIVSRVRHKLCRDSELIELMNKLQVLSVEEILMYYLGQPGVQREKSLKLAVGRIVHDVLYHMLDATNDVQQHVMFVYAAHDNFMMPLMLALGVLQPKWPPFAADLEFELWMNTEVITQPNWHVRIMYCGEQLLWCSLEDFLAKLRPFAISQEEFDTVCPPK